MFTHTDTVTEREKKNKYFVQPKFMYFKKYRKITGTYDKECQLHNISKLRKIYCFIHSHYPNEKHTLFYSKITQWHDTDEKKLKLKKKIRIFFLVLSKHELRDDSYVHCTLNTIDFSFSSKYLQNIPGKHFFFVFPFKRNDWCLICWEN